MNLENVIPCLMDARVSGPREGLIAGLADDSRKVVSGGVFVAVRGHLVDGHEYIDKAIQAGASVIVAFKASSASCWYDWDCCG